MSEVNTTVVRALMSLRGISQQTLCTLAHVTDVDMAAWLDNEGNDSDTRVDYSTQLEILQHLGIYGQAPRPDVVHYWRVHEAFFSRAEPTYWPLGVILKSFGNAQVAFLARESDPAVTFQARSCYALKFAGFQAILEVTSHPLRSISFDPERMQHLSWLPDSFGVLLPDEQYDRLQPGAMKVKGLTQYLTYTTEMAEWEKLREIALERGIRANQVATALLIAPSAPATPATEEPELQTRHAEPQAAEVRAEVRTEVRTEARQPEPVTAASVTPISRDIDHLDDLKLYVRPAKAALRAV